MIGIRAILNGRVSFGEGAVGGDGSVTVSPVVQSSALLIPDKLGQIVMPVFLETILSPVNAVAVCLPPLLSLPSYQVPDPDPTSETLQLNI